MSTVEQFIWVNLYSLDHSWHSFVIINRLSKVWKVRGICHKGAKLLNKLKPSMFLRMPQLFPEDQRPTQTHWDNQKLWLLWICKTSREIQKGHVLFSQPCALKSVNLQYKGWRDEFDGRLNIIIGIVQKVYEWPSCLFTKLIPLWLHNYGKRTAWSLIYFLNYAY